MSANPQVSVVMAVRNAESSAARAVKGILQQTFSDFEFLIINDGSTDSTGRVLREVTKGDKRVRIVSLEHGGLTRALIAGCEMAKGHWIVRQDADDWSEHARLESALSFAAKNSACHMVGSWVDYRGPCGEFLETVQRPTDCGEATLGLMKRGQGPPAHGCMMFRRDTYEKVGGYREAFYFAQDSDLWLRLGAVTRIGYVPSTLYHYTLSPSAISGRHAGRQRQFGELAHACHLARRDGLPEEPCLEAARALAISMPSNSSESHRRAEAAAYYRIGVQLARRGDRAASKYFLQTLRGNPFHWRAMLRWALQQIKR